MSTQDPGRQPVDIPPQGALLQMVTGYWVSQAIAVATKLGIPDLLKDGPKSSQEPAAATSTHEPSLYRLLRVLASVGLLTEGTDRRFARTSLSACLESDVPGSLRAFTLLKSEPWLWSSWTALRHSIKTGQAASEQVHGMGQFEYFAQHPQAAEIFDQAMTNLATQWHTAALTAYDFSRYRTVVDIGGGHGALLTALLTAHRQLRGVLFDQPHVVEGAKPRLTAAGLTQRCEMVGGNFFDSVPAGGDLYLLGHILIDWDDARATTILQNIRQARAPEGKLLILEEVIPQGPGPSWEKLLDLNMLVVLGGRGRTEREFRTLLGQAGFELSRIIPTGAPIRLIEGVCT
jgi:hypothetical protein